jgi:hypothetical protein
MTGVVLQPIFNDILPFPSVIRHTSRNRLGNSAVHLNMDQCDGEI